MDEKHNNWNQQTQQSPPSYAGNPGMPPTGPNGYPLEKQGYPPQTPQQGYPPQAPQQGNPSNGQYGANPPPITGKDYQADFKDHPPEYQEVEKVTNADLTPAFMSVFGCNRLHVKRHNEPLNQWLGWDCLNQYSITNEQGNTVGYIRERDSGSMKAVLQRQMSNTGRAYVIEFFDVYGIPILMVSRGFTLMKSNVGVFLVGVDHQGQPAYKRVGFSKEKYHLVKRKYILNLGTKENPHAFGFINAEPLAWTFDVRDDKKGNDIAQIKRKWMGVAREAFTDSNAYDIDFMNLPMDQRAVVLGCMISIDFDFFTHDK
ncbi:hypothetical protein DICA4_B12574 [Diutina catenulata]